MMPMRWREDWLLLPQRFALHEPTATAVVADLHLGYSAARQRLGDAIPSRSVHEEIQPLLDAKLHFPICNIVIAGDLFERGYNREIAEQFMQLLHEYDMQLLGVVPGNHDRGIAQAGASLPTFADGYDLAGWRIVHGDQPIEHAQSVSGHWHPAVRQGRSKMPCFLTCESQLVLPAFSLDAAGVDIGRDKRWRGWTCYAIQRNEVLALNT